MKKRVLTIILMFILIPALACSVLLGCSSGAVENETAGESGIPETKMFTDSTGREVAVPAGEVKVAATGALAQMIIFALCPDRMAGIADPWDKSAEQFLNEKYLNLPILGQLYGGKGDMNLETLIGSGAKLIIDIGQSGENVAKDMDELQDQTGIPFVHIDMTTAGAGDMFRTLGELLGLEDEAAALADYCDRVYERTLKIAEKAEKKKAIYISGENGLNVIAKNSYHSEMIDVLADNLAVIDNPSSKATGNEVDMEQILLWNPDVILVAPGSIYDRMGADPTWQKVNAVKNGTYYEIPFGPHNWMGFPPSVQRWLGMMWMAKLLYPEEADYDLFSEVQEFYRLFYHCELSEEQYNELMKGSINK